MTMSVFTTLVRIMLTVQILLVRIPVHVKMVTIKLAFFHQVTLRLFITALDIFAKMMEAKDLEPSTMELAKKLMSAWIQRIQFVQ